MDKYEYILCELSAPVVFTYRYIFSHPGVSSNDIKNEMGYSLVSIKRFIRTLKNAGLIIEKLPDKLFCSDMK